jgi:hypothetical protein
LLKRHAETYLSQKKKTVTLAVLIYASAPPALCSWKGQWIGTIDFKILYMQCGESLALRSVSGLPTSGIAITAVNPNVTVLSYCTACTIIHKGVLI